MGSLRHFGRLSKKSDLSDEEKFALIEEKIERASRRGESVTAYGYDMLNPRRVFGGVKKCRLKRCSSTKFFRSNEGGRPVICAECFSGQDDNVLSKETVEEEEKVYRSGEPLYIRNPDYDPTPWSRQY